MYIELPINYIVFVHVSDSLLKGDYNASRNKLDLRIAFPADDPDNPTLI
jgi:hypothetical protein